MMPEREEIACIGGLQAIFIWDLWQIQNWLFYPVKDCI